MDEKLNFLIEFLLDEMPEYQSDAANISDKKILLRSLMNVRPPRKLNPKFLEIQDEFLSNERDAKGIINADELPEIQHGISIWQGDITRLDADAIVNAANERLLGCFIPCHRCIDNAIHSAAGLQLRNECNEIMKAQGHDELTGSAKITRAYNLPSKFVIHTVGPIVFDAVTESQRVELESCYKSCLELADEKNLKSLAFCCISTGEFHFPNDEAAKIAVKTVKNFLPQAKSLKKIIFNVFRDLDLKIYEKELKN